VSTHHRRLAVGSAAVLLLASLTTACGSFNSRALLPSADQGASSSPSNSTVPANPAGAGARVQAAPAGQAATATNAAGAAARPSTSIGVPVKRDSIADTLTLDGVVAPAEQVAISYPNRGVIGDMRAKIGTTVSQGDVLVDIDRGDLTGQQFAANTRLQTSIANLAQGHLQADAQKQAAAQQVAADQRARQQAVADAQANLRHAQENLAKVQAGASTSDRQSAQAAVDAAGAALAKGQAAQDKLLAGPDIEAIKAAQRELTANQVLLTKAQTDYNTLTGGPDPKAMRDAQAQVSRAENQLQIAQAAPVDPKANPTIAKIQHDAAIQDAQLALQNAQDAVIRLKQPPADTDVRAADQRVRDAQDAVTAGKTKLASLQAGATDTDLEAAQTAVDNAQQAFDMAQANLAAVLARPTRAELADAQDQIRKAQAGVDAAGRTQAGTTDATGSVDLDALQKLVDDNQAEVARLQKLLEDTHIRAPFDATVASVKAKIGDAITADKPLVVLAKPGTSIVNVASLSDSEVARLAAGQPATVNFETLSGTPRSATATVDFSTPAAADGSTQASASFKVSWAPNQAPRFGTPVQVTVTVQQKDGVLVVPKDALRQSGDKTTVMVLNGTLRRLVDVQVGIVTGTSAEIISGLNEGQLVLPQL
jgi:HlyD family secretion protein